MQAIRTKNILFFVCQLALLYCAIFSARSALAYTATLDLSCNAVYPDGSPWVQTGLQITTVNNTIQAAASTPCTITLTTFTDDFSNVYTPGTPGDYLTISLSSTGNSSGASAVKRYTSGVLEVYLSAIATSYAVKFLNPTMSSVASPFQLSVRQWDNDNDNTTDNNNTPPTVLGSQVNTSTPSFTANGTYDGSAGLCKYFTNKTLPTNWTTARSTYQLTGSGVFSCGSYSASSGSWSLTQSLTGLSGVNLFIIVAGECNGSAQCGFTVFDLSGY